MKRLLPALIIAVLVVSLCALPVSAIGIGQVASVATQPATNITPYSATLNANLTWPALGMDSQQSGLRPVSTRMDLADYNHSGFCYFKYGTSSGALTSSTPTTAVPYGAARFAADVVGLFPCTTYYYQPVFIFAEVPSDYQPAPANYLIALATTGGDKLSSGLGIGLNRLVSHDAIAIPNPQPVTGQILFFTTTGCVINTPSHNASGLDIGSNGIGLSNITVQSATLSTSRVAPGEKVDITALVTNNGNQNGESKITLYINGEQRDSRGVTVASGKSVPVHFYISENQPGTYNVHVGSVSAGSFTVDTFGGTDAIIYGVIMMFIIGIASTLYMLVRKRPV